MQTDSFAQEANLVYGFQVFDRCNSNHTCFGLSPHRFAYTTGPYARSMFEEVHERNIHADDARRSLQADADQETSKSRLHNALSSAEFEELDHQGQAHTLITSQALAQQSLRNYKLQQEYNTSNTLLTRLLQRVLQADQADSAVIDINHAALDELKDSGSGTGMSSDTSVPESGVNLTPQAGTGNAGSATKQQVFYAVKHFPHKDDAFHSIIQWLLAKIPDTR